MENHYKRLDDVADDGHRALYNLICDYEMINDLYGFCTIEDFLTGWTLIRYKEFSNLKIGDFIYNASGEKYIVTEEPWESDDETYLIVEVAPMIGDVQDTDKNHYTYFDSGTAYNKPYVHQWELYKRQIMRGENKICPFFITNQVQPQN